MTLIIIFFLMAIFFFIVAGVCLSDDEFMSGIIPIFLGILFLFFASFEINENGEKQGQVDAMTGKIHYELKTNPDSTKEWVLIKNK